MAKRESVYIDVIPAPPEGLRDPVSFRWFAEDRHKDTPELTPLPADYAEEWRRGLQTQTGKLEFELSCLKRFSPDDPDRPPIMKYRASWQGPATTELFEKYPLQLITPHSRYSYHTHRDGKDSFTSDITDHRVLVDGRYYRVARISHVDADARGISEHDLVRLYNDRGAVICVAKVNERVRPGTVHSYESSAVYAPTGKSGFSDDLGGCVNLLTPARPIVQKSHSIAANSCLIQVERTN